MRFTILARLAMPGIHRAEHRIAADPLVSLKSFNADTDRRHVRRELAPEELMQLIRSTATRTLAEHRISGPDRAMVYRLALGTGLRASELRSHWGRNLWQRH